MILQKQITTPKDTILVIGGLPEDAFNIGFNDKGNLYFFTQEDRAYPPQRQAYYNLNIGSNWQPLGFLKDITEEQAKELVEYKHLISSCVCEECAYDIDCYRNYLEQTDEEWERYPSADRAYSAIKSLYSLVEANCLLENVWGDKPDKNFERYHKVWNEQCFDREWYENDLNRWNKEQEKVFTNPYLLLKHN